MEIKFQCSNPACLQKLAVDDSYLGRKFPCPACGIVLVVPSPLRCIPSAPAKAEPRMETPLPLDARLFRLLIAWGVGLGGCILLMTVIHVSRFLTETRLPRHLDQIIKEVDFPEGLLDVAPACNYKENLLLYERKVRGGTGIFLANLGNDERKQIELAPTAKIPPRLIGWSPDDQYLAFAVTGKKQSNQQILIRDGSSGDASDSFELPDSLEQGAWLSTNSLVLYARHKLYLFNVQGDYKHFGNYGKQGLVSLPFDALAVPSSLVPVGGRAVAYDDGSNIWFYGILNNRTTQLTHMTNVNIGELDYSPENDSFLFSLNVRGKQVDPSLYRLDPRINAAKGGIAQFIDRHDFDRIYSGKWISGGAGLVYAAQNSIGVSLNADGLSFHTNLFAGGRYQSYSVSPRGDKIFAIASQSGEPLGVWEYDINYGDLDNVVPPKEHLSVSQWAVPTTVEIARKGGGGLSYLLLPPTDLAARKKNPAVLNLFNDNSYDVWPQLMANAGIFSVSIHPRTPDDVEAIADDLLKRADVDPQKIYIVGQAKDAAMIQSLLKDNPARWRGVILLWPSAFQPLPKSPVNFPPFLILGGRDKGPVYAVEAGRFVRTACQKLIPIRLVFDQDIARAAPKNADLNQEYYKMMAKFILTGDLN